MRKKTHITIILLVVIITLIGTYIIYGKVRNQDKDQDKVITRISVILPHSDDGYWSLIEEGIYAAEEEYLEGFDIQIYIPQLNYNIGQMTDLIKRQVAANVDAIIVQGNNDEGYINALLEAQKNNIQVILIDTDIDKFPEHLYIGTNNYEAGVYMGNRLIDISGGKAKVAIMSGEKNYSNLEERYNGLMEAIRLYPEIDILAVEYNNYDGLTAKKKYTEIRENNPEVDTLVCLEGTSGETIGAIFNEKRYEYRYILTFDYSEQTRKGILLGNIDGTLAQDTYQIGYQAIKEVTNHVDYGRYSNNIIHTNIRWITSSMIEEKSENEE